MVSLRMTRLLFLVSTVLLFETTDLPSEDDEEIDPFAEQMAQNLPFKRQRCTCYVRRRPSFCFAEDDNDPLSAFNDEDDDDSADAVLSFEEDNVPEIKMAHPVP